MRSFYRAMLAASFVSLSVAACMHDKRKDGADPKLTPEQQKAADDYAAEVEIGRNMAGRLLSYYGIVDDPKLVGYVNQVGDYVASYSDFPERKYMFAVLNHESVNAFACPGGYILVTLGAIRAAHNEAELAAVLGHEITHVGKRHMMETLKKMREKDLEAAANANKDKHLDPALKVRERPVAEESAFGTQLASYMTGKAGAGLNILQAAQAGMTLITSKGLGPEMEFEADAEGVKFAIRAGYEPKAMLHYLKRLEEHSEKKIKNLEKTHPPTAERRKAIAKLLLTLKADDIIGATGQDRFDKIHKALPKPEKG